MNSLQPTGIGHAIYAIVAECAENPRDPTKWTPVTARRTELFRDHSHNRAAIGRDSYHSCTAIYSDSSHNRTAFYREPYHNYTALNQEPESWNPPTVGPHYSASNRSILDLKTFNLDEACIQSKTHRVAIGVP